MADPRVRPDVPELHANEMEHRRLLAKRANGALMRDGSNAMANPLVLSAFDVAGLPDPSLWEGGLVALAESSARVPAYSTGSRWLRLGSPALKNVLHYGAVGDGAADDTAAVQAALSDSAAPLTLVPPGIYAVTGLSLLGLSTLWLMRGATIFLIDGSDTHVITIDGDGSGICGGGTIDGNRANQAANSGSGIFTTGHDDVWIDGQGLVVTQCADRGIHVTDGDRGFVRGIRTSFTTRMGIQGQARNLKALDDFTVEHCIVDRSDNPANGDGGIEVTGDSTATSVARPRVAGCRCFFSNSPTGSQVVGIEFFGPTTGGPGLLRDGEIVGCHIVGSSIGISVASGATGCIVSHSSVEDANNIGIEIANAQENLIASCTVNGRHNTTNGIVLNNNAGPSLPTVHNEIADATVIDCVDRSILVIDADTAYVTIEGGTLVGSDSTADGVFVLNSGGHVICNGITVDLAGTGTTQRRGFVFSNSNNCSFRNGQIKNAHRGGQLVANNFAGEWYRIAENDFVGCTNPNVQQVLQGTGTLSKVFIENNMGDDLV